MKKSLTKIGLCIIVGILVISGCKGLGVEPIKDGTLPGFNVTFDSIDVSDSTVLAIEYSTYVTPEGFYSEDLQGGAIYYESNLSITPSQNRQPPFFFLSTDSKDQARAWSESSSVNSAYYRDFVSERETERYFEFRRVYKQRPSDILLSRVNKLSYIDRSMYFFPSKADLIGRLNARPIDGTQVQSLSEYLWFIENFDLYGSKVLAVVPKDGTDSTYCALYRLTMSGGDWGLHDDISLLRTTVSVAKASGDIIRRDSVLRHIQGRSN